jgi:hypothetical protein
MTNAYNITFRTYKQESELLCPIEPLPDSAIAPLLETELGAAEGGLNRIPVAECGKHVDGETTRRTRSHIRRAAAQYNGHEGA